MTNETESVDAASAEAAIHKRSDLEVLAFGEGIELRRVKMDTIMQTWIEMKQGHFSPLHRHPDEQSLVLVSGRLRARCGPNGSEVYTDMEPGDIMTVPSNAMHQVEALEDAVFLEAFGPGHNAEKASKSPEKRKAERAAAKAAAAQTAKE